MNCLKPDSLKKEIGEDEQIKKILKSSTSTKKTKRNYFSRKKNNR